MPSIFRETLTPTVDADGICESQTPSAGGEQSLIINGALVVDGIVNLNHAQHIEISTTVDDSARTFVVTGTNSKGLAQTESISGPTTTTVGNKYFKTITGITVDANTAGAITVGLSGAASSGIFLTNIFAQNFKVGFLCRPTGTLNYTVQSTLDDVNIDDISTIHWLAHDVVASKTTEEDGNYEFPVTGIRVIIGSYTSGSLAIDFIQSG